MTNNWKTATLIVIVVGCIISITSAGIIASGLSNVGADPRTVSVRGLAEREVAADTAVWPLTYTIGSNSLTDLTRQIQKNTVVIKDYLQRHNLSAADYSVQNPAITDTTTNVYMQKSENNWRYIAKNVILIRSSDIAAVNSAVADSLELLDNNIAVTKDYDSLVTFYFNGLNDIKPDMIADATKNAREAAEKFALDSGSKIGKIRTASQGLFSIDDAAPGLPERKTVRVVTTIVYDLAD